MSNEPFEFVGIDASGLFKINTLKYINHFTKYIEAEAVKDVKSKTVADFFINYGVLRHGAIKRCITDRAQSCCVNFTQEILNTLSTKHIFTSAYHLQTNGCPRDNARQLQIFKLFTVELVNGIYFHPI